MSTYSNEDATSVYKFLLVENTNSQVFLAPTRITFSSYKWVETLTSTCTGSNLYKENKQFSLAPPFHPCFSYLNVFSTNCRKTDITLHTNSVMIFFLIYAPWFPSLSSFWISRDLCHSAILTLPMIHASNSLSAERQSSLPNSHPFIEVNL